MIVFSETEHTVHNYPIKSSIDEKEIPVLTADREAVVEHCRREAVKVGTVIVASETASNKRSLVSSVLLLGNTSSTVLHIIPG